MPHVPPPRRIQHAAVVAIALIAAVPAWAQPAAPPPATAAQPQAAATPPAPPPDPVVATVNGQAIHLSDLSEAARGLPENMRGMPESVLFPLILERQVDLKALAAQARKEGLDQDPTVKRQIALATESALQGALLAREVGPKVSEQAVHAKYDAEIAGKPGEEEVHAAHILVGTEDEAKKVIADLKKGADFAAEAKAHSTDPGGKDGGDLGWFRHGDMVPEFADAAFAMKPGQVSDKPVHSQFGWHIIKVEGRRQAPAPTFEASHDELRQKMIQEGVQQAVQQARAEAKIETFNLDGTPRRATDTAEPPAAPSAGSPATPPAGKP
jgi:peptidyl-prolyl cis-trans isomerase C